MSEKQEILDAAEAGDVAGFFGALYRRNFCECETYEEVTLAEVFDVMVGDLEGHEVIRAQLKRLNQWMEPLWKSPGLCYWQGVDEELLDDEFDEVVERCFHRYREFASQ